MERRPDVGLDSYDRLFPNQDTMPQGGFGNLIALPLQKGPREQGHSVFLDDRLVPRADQWAFLASVRKLGRAQVEGIVQEAERRGRILDVRLPPLDDGEDDPWTAPPSRHRKEPAIVGELPQTLALVLGNQIYIAKDGLHPGLRNRLLRLAAFQNPEFYKAQGRCTQGRSPSHHFHAMRPGPASSERESTGGRATVRASRPRATDDVPVG